jgi:hypothetical protein
MDQVFPSHSSDALYQGTTFSRDLRPNKNPGLKGRKEVQVTRRNQSRRDGTICSPARKCRVGFHPNRVPEGRHNGEFSRKLFSPWAFSRSSEAQAPNILRKSVSGRRTRLNPCTSFINATRKNLLPFRQQPINKTNLILFGQALFKAINKSHRQKANCSGNLDSSEVQPSLRDLIRKSSFLHKVATMTTFVQLNPRISLKPRSRQPV